MAIRPQPRHLVIDANVLIDYARTDKTILALAGETIGSVLVPEIVLAEVDDLTRDECVALGLRLVEIDVDVLVDLAKSGGTLSLEDRVCLHLARTHAHTCVTNDKALRRECKKSRVSVMWGLELMSELIVAGALDVGRAIAIARDIHAENPMHITKEIVARFELRVREGAGESS